MNEQNIISKTMPYHKTLSNYARSSRVVGLELVTGLRVISGPVWIYGAKV
jgi:hypothetical protein